MKEWKISPKVGTIVRPLPCGCKADLTKDSNPNAGTIQNPWTVNFCPLHAAAPELLEACQKAADVIQCGYDIKTLESWARDLVGMLRAAVSKAEGKE